MVAGCATLHLQPQHLMLDGAGSSSHPLLHRWDRRARLPRELASARFFAAHDVIEPVATKNHIGIMMLQHRGAGCLYHFETVN